MLSSPARDYLSLGVNARELTSVGLADDGDRHVEIVHQPFVRFPDVFELFIAGDAEEYGRGLRERGSNHGKGAPLETSPIKSEDQRLRDIGTIYGDLVALADLHGVVDDDVRDSLNSDVFHGNLESRNR